MPDKPLTVITYAASASLAAIALVYFFNPNYTLDSESSTLTASTRKKSVVGLSNPANDCFINSVLQSLAGLGDLRLYLIRELHRRRIDGPAIYTSIPEQDKHGKPLNAKKLLSLQSGEVTQGLKDMIDGLNERPIYKKTISASKFVGVLEHAFGTRISKSQQDAQELLQVVAERLSEEYHAGKEARKRARAIPEAMQKAVNDQVDGLGLPIQDQEVQSVVEEAATNAQESVDGGASLTEEEDGFPLEGETESVIECQQCQFIPKAKPVSFVMLTLPVPQKNSTSLNDCFDSHFKTEYIDDYKCDKCRLEHALSIMLKDLTRASEKQKLGIERDIARVRKAIQDDPEKPPEGVILPDNKYAPTRRIARHVKITTFPKILVIHLSRSIYDPRSSSTKNAAKVAFPEQLPIGSLLDRRNYKLLGMVTHKGTHNSGHYESFRRQHLYAPFSTPHLWNPLGPYTGATTPDPSANSSPRITIRHVPTDPRPSIGDSGEAQSSSSISSPSTSSAALSPPSTRPSSGSVNESFSHKPSHVPAIESGHEAAEKASILQDVQSSPFSTPRNSSVSKVDSLKLKRRKKSIDRWWRISDDKIKECKTGDVLGMQKEVYMLFYEMEKG